MYTSHEYKRRQSSERLLYSWKYSTVASLARETLTWPWKEIISAHARNKEDRAFLLSLLEVEPYGKDIL